MRSAAARLAVTPVAGVSGARPTVSGKFLHVDDDRFLIKGVSYGTFAPDAGGALFPEPVRVAHDFEAIARLGANTVRTYTTPPEHVLDEAEQCGLRVIAGLPWPQHVAFLDSRAIEREIRSAVRDGVERLASHPATLLFTVGNEIPPGVVRWYGRRRIERFLRELYDEAKTAAPDALITYINYPPTEYLDLSFFDVCAFNVFLHDETELSAYLTRLHHVAGSRPLLVAEAGADSLRNGEAGQAALVTMQVRTAFREGAAGAIVFSWTDDWWRGGQRVDDWRFGLVDASRRAKPAYAAVQRVFQSPPSAHVVPEARPRVSVVVCAYNAAATIDECLTSLEQLRYPDFEVIVVNDGSTDQTGAIAARHPIARLITTPNSGLATARNIGLHEATGDIVAYTDADVRVDPEWLRFLVQRFADDDVVAVGGPNIVPADDPWIAQCVARAPGAPTHVLLDDRTAEHIPGCNCAFRRDALAAIGGFNPIFVRAGDDVDVCWRLQARGGRVGFAPAALVWHHHRASVRGYLRQQIGYGEGETWLLHEHPEQFAGGRINWRGHIYSPLPFIRSLSEMRINAGPFGSAPFPSVYRTDAHPFAYITHSGRWQLAWLLLLAIAVAATLLGKPYGSPLLMAAVLAIAATCAKCLVYGFRSDVGSLPPIGRLSPGVSRIVYRLTIAALHFLQPFARLRGRIRGAISRPASAAAVRPADPPSREPFGHAVGLLFGLEVEKVFWSERWIDMRALFSSIADRLRRQRAARQIELDSGWWEDRDLTVLDRPWFRLDVRALVEEHGQERCLCRIRMRAHAMAILVPLMAAFAAVLLVDAAGLVSWPIATAVAVLLAAAIALKDIVSASRAVWHAVDQVAAEAGMTSMASVAPPHAARVNAQ